MAFYEQLEILKRGLVAWNEWRAEHPAIVVDLRGAHLSDADLSFARLSEANLSHADLRRVVLRFAILGGADLRFAVLSDADLSGVDFSGADLRGANLRRAVLRGANLNGANLSDADLHDADLNGVVLHGANLRAANLSSANLSFARLSSANLSDADFGGANLHSADLCDANLSSANLSSANLSSANLRAAILSSANLSSANLTDADLSSARLDKTYTDRTLFTGLNLRGVIGLEEIHHGGPSEISLSTIFLSEGKIPEAFLLGCGVPESFILQIPALVVGIRPIQFNSCFISYSSKDDEFAMRLHARMRQEGLRVWFAPEDMKGGDSFFDQIDRAIQVHDRLLLVLSENSITSNWVIREIKRARLAEARESRKKLFPITLTDYESLRRWECLDDDSGLDLAEEIRRFHIPDFSNWKDHDDFEKAFARLRNDLMKSAETQ